MKHIFNGVKTNFRVKFNNNKDKFVLLLHGWGGNLNSFLLLEKYLLENNFSVVSLDFPGFNKSDIPNENFCLDDYVKVVRELLQFLKIEKTFVVAHSFGGRVAIKLASSTSTVQKLVLVDSAGLKPRFSLIRYLKIRCYKFLKWLKSKNIIKRDLNKFGSEDYKNLPSSMKKVFVRVVNEDLSCYLKNITCPTLLVWGKKDKATPLYMAKKMKRKIKDSGLVVYKNAGHFSYLDNYNEFLLVINSFFSKIL